MEERTCGPLCPGIWPEGDLDEMIFADEEPYISQR